MSDNNNAVLQSSFHQRSQSMPLRHTFINNNNTSSIFQKAPPPSYDFNSVYKSLKKEDSDSQQENNSNFPILTSSKLTYSHFRSAIIPGDDRDSDFFYPSKSELDMFDKDNKLSLVSLNCKLSKGFFKSDSHWTCYRRNYFQVTVSLSISNFSNLEYYTLQLLSNSHDRQQHRVRQFLVNIRACVYGEDNKNTDESNVKLTQMTPKRDKGPVREPPMLPIQPASYVTFERLQFKAATANNGRRKASQQFFCLVVELRAQLEDDSQHIISTCSSMPLVVRGRSPGHYNGEKKVKKYAIVRRERPSSPEKSNRATPEPTYSSPPATISETSDFAAKTMTLSVPHMLLNGFGQTHGRSQSANDPHFITRHNRKYQTNKITEESYQQSLFHDDSMAGIDRALRQWELQAAKYREESTSAFHSYVPTDGRSEASTPTPYQDSNDRPLYPQHEWHVNYSS